MKGVCASKDSTRAALNCSQGLARYRMASEPPECVALVVQSATVPSFQAAIMRVLSVDALEKITG